MLRVAPSLLIATVVCDHCVPVCTCNGGMTPMGMVVGKPAGPALL